MRKTPNGDATYYSLFTEILKFYLHAFDVELPKAYSHFLNSQKFEFQSSKSDFDTCLQFPKDGSFKVILTFWVSTTESVVVTVHLEL